MVDALITNFHLPESTLLMLVCAFAGYEHVMALYRHAIEAHFRDNFPVPPGIVSRYRNLLHHFVHQHA